MNLYRDTMMDHYKNPRNFGSAQNPSVTAPAHNPFCGDTLEVDVVITDNVISDFKFRGDMCAVAMSAASMLSEDIIGQTLEQARHITREKLLTYFGSELTTSRVKCATLVLDALTEALTSYDKTKTN